MSDKENEEESIQDEEGITVKNEKEESRHQTKN